MKTKTLLLLTVILSLCIIQIQAYDDVDIFNPFDDDAKLERCMSKRVVNRITGTTTTTSAGHGVKGHCRICRADKDDYGVNISSSEAQTGEDAKGTYALRPTEKRYNAQLNCQEDINEDQVQVKYDQENKIPRCEIYDHYGLCVRCMIGYGLQWNPSAVGTEEQTGAYRCIDNQYRTPYCHKYNSSNQCIECKWNQDPEQKYIYQRGNTSDQTYRLDFALYNVDGKTYCVNNEQLDPQLKQDGNKLVLAKLTPDCASYDSSQKCTRCHTRKFNLEGIKQYNDIHIDIDTAQDETYTKPILDFHLNQQDKPVCNTLPSWFKTDPSQLKKWDTAWTSASTNNAECITGDLLKGGTSIYGCGTSVPNCSTYTFDWDLEHFQKEGVWVKKITGCATCANTYILNSSEQTCQKIEGNFERCNGADVNGCTGCTTGSIQKKEINGSLKNVCTVYTTTAHTIDDCITQYYDKDNVKRCTRCDPGYVIKDNGSGEHDSCKKITQYIEIRKTDGTALDTVRYELYERGCLKINIENKCQSTGGYGYTKKSDSSSGGRCKYGLMYDQMLCKTDETQIEESYRINGCKEYVTVYDETRCFKCEEEHFINYSGSRCLKMSDSTAITVPNCVIQDGPWCQRCKRDDSDAENPVYYELTQYNTCVRMIIASGATEASKQCVYRNYNISGKQLSPGNCLLCTDKYFVNGSNECEILESYEPDASNERVPVFTTEDRTGELNPNEWELLHNDRQVSGCRIYTNDKDGDSNLIGHCFECDRVNNVLYGARLSDPDDANSQYICSACEENQILKEDNGHIVCANVEEHTTDPMNSNNCLDTGSCEVCEFGYEVDYTSAVGVITKSCEKQISYGCSKLDYSSVIGSTYQRCSSCQHPFFLNSSYECQFIIPNCITISGKTCTKCDPGYELNGGKCYRKSDLCETQDWDISKDPNSNLPRAHVCKTCFNINSSTDYIRLFMKDGTLRQGCMSGCEDQKLYRYMNTRSDSNPFNVWTCNECRNDHYHYLNTESRKNCQPAQVITNCAYYVNETTDGTSKCRQCFVNYSLEEQGTRCNTCTLVTNCAIYDQTQSSVGDNNRCACKTCDTGFTLNNNECTSQTSLANCKVQASSTECSECNSEFFLTDDKKCSAFTATNCQTKSTTANECLTCIQGYEKNESKVCVQITGINNCQTHESRTLCLICADGYGLNFDRTSCLNNSESGEYRSAKCFQYSNNTVKETFDNIIYPVCIKCYEGFALDYDHEDIQKQCVKATLCQRGRYNTGDHITQEQTCQECLKVDGSGKLVYRTNKGTGGTCRTDVGTNDIDNCRVYNNYSSNSANTCYDCHEGYSPDSDGSDDNNSTICVSDYHPGSLPGCLFYDEANGTGLKWLKYEWLKCKTCEIEWRFHSASSEITRKRYSANTYTRDCDVVEQVNLAAIAPNVWTGKDGGLRSSQTTGDDDDDGPIIIPDDREQYEDPIVFANILSFSAILILAIVTVL